MLVHVHMIEGQAHRAKSRELCFDFRAHLPASAVAQSQPHAERDEIAAQPAPPVEKSGNGLRRQGRPRGGDRKMKPYAQARHRPRAPDGVRRARSGRHQARGREDALAMGDFDRLVDFRREPEIIRRDGQKTQAEKPPRARRNEKNSTPSRKRRTIICGLRAISEAIAAIFGARK